MRQTTRFSLILSVVISLFLSTAPSQAADSLAISGKGMWLWQLWSSNSNNLATTTTKLKNLGVTWVVIKLADGNSDYNSPNHSFYNWVVPAYGSLDSVVKIFHANGIKLFGYQYVYGISHKYSYTESETDVALKILGVPGLDGLMIDAEIQYDTLTNRAVVAKAYMDSIRAHFPESFVGLTAWARVTGHSSFPWTSFLDQCDVNMPQTYWAARPTTPQNELSLMNTQFTNSTATWVSQGDSAAAKPIMPIGQGCYFGYSNDVKQGEITSFCDLSQNTYHYPGVSLWEYNQITHTYVFDEYTAAWVLTSVAENETAPLQFGLSQNFPNPFNPSTTIRFSLAATGRVQLTIFDLLGQEIARVVDGSMNAGEHSVTWNAHGLSSGVYLYRLQTPGFSATKKLLLLR